ncbi:cobalt ABC transporter ATP-binding protein [Halodesulfurarchaeum formicicum]|uniref:ABC transporter ATP-binding protein n=1 Tax=Halodesulfurarchaeum formicicum TaxID=1873524 RepID=A0A1D8S6L7_9EURY|nr:ABC transporter ATP-binding protein [Halodesulfurarchaeum formicicum]AOW81004.1 cobalt ABC transporter ATP-binding protein [Halodesulfurarchaeum formicicum]
MTLRAEGVAFAYHGSPVLTGVDFTAETGVVTALLGPNGAGKSTLLKHFNGLLRPDAGRVLVDGTEIEDDEAILREVRSRVGFVFQNPADQLIAPTVRQDVTFGPRNIGVADAVDVDSLLARVGLPDAGDRHPHTMSNGEQKRVALAGVLAMDPDYVVMDEPTAGLDGDGAAQFVGLIEDLVAAGVTVLLSTHHVGFATTVADRIAVLTEGEIKYEGKGIDRETAVQFGLRTWAL